MSHSLSAATLPADSGHGSIGSLADCLHWLLCCWCSLSQYLSASDASAIDALLMSEEYGFTLDALMELAGLSCAAAIHRCYPPASHPTVLVCVGPGNNGGDGLVAARHLHHFGYSAIHILLVKRPTKATYRRLVAQNEQLGATFHTSPPTPVAAYSLLVDAVFGFSFDPSDGIRAPYDSVIAWLIAAAQQRPVVAIDVPSGWHVEDGDVAGGGLRPHMLLSLTAPKRCARHFTGQWHILGGRFVPPAIAKQFQLRLPQYSGREQFAVITAPSDIT